MSMLLLLALAAAPADEPLLFDRDVRPLLSSRCFACHGPDEAARQADLRLDAREHVLADRGGYAAVVPGEPDTSELVARILDAEDPMPPADSGLALTEAERATLVRWIAEGAEWAEHWAYRPPTRPTPPRDDVAPIDAFVLERLEREGLSPSPQADRVTLLRRLSFDLVGLPPTPEQLDSYLADNAPDAYMRVVERLLDSPQHGERLAQHWLDLVRYGDSGGYHSDNPIPMSPYRDWVIEAFTANMRFDRFTVEQLAGDLLPHATTAQRVASGYNRLNKTTEEGGAQPGEYMAKYMADRVRTTSSVWLGATMGCAECHDHKFDPIGTAEFYSFGAFFADIEEHGVYERTGSRRPPEMRVPDTASELELDVLAVQIDALRASADSPERLSELEARRDAIEAALPLTLVTRAVEPREVRVLPRGNWLDESGPVVQPGVPACMPPLDVGDERATRLDLGRWLVSDEHPLTARVFVNRLWRLLFGVGLSSKLDDLGAQGEWPVHPELLDWLAVEFVESGWDVRHLLRSIVSSRTYRQSSLESAELRARDPANRLLARQSRWRIEAEFVRDTALSISGLLDASIGGPSVFPYQPAGYWAHLNFPGRRWRASDGADQHRRGLYTHWQRTFPHPSLLAFDAPSREECTAERASSNTPQAALVLLNDPTYVEAARALAARVLEEQHAGDAQRLERAFRLSVSRHAEARELGVLAGLLSAHREHYAAQPEAARGVGENGIVPPPAGVDAVELAAWTSVARALLALHETITRS